MRKYIVTLSDGSKDEIEVPLTYYDMPTWMYEDIHEKWDGLLTPESLIKLFSIVTKRNFKDYASSTDSKLESLLLNSVRFILENQMDMNALVRDDSFSIDGITVVLPTELKKLTLGQNLYIRRCLYNKDIRSGIALACAVYLQPLLDNDNFKDDRVEYWADRIRQMPIVKTYPIGFFILRRLNSSGNGLIRLWDLICSIMQRSIAAVLQSLPKPNLNYSNLTTK